METARGLTAYGGTHPAVAVHVALRVLLTGTTMLFTAAIMLVMARRLNPPVVHLQINPAPAGKDSEGGPA